MPGAQDAQEPAPLVFISSDGHVTARMREYRPYLDARWHESFDEFLPAWEADGAQSFERRTLELRMDAETLDAWDAMTAPDRLDGCHDPSVRIREADREGVSAEVLFPEFGLPFRLHSPFRSAALHRPAVTPEEIDAGNHAFARWLSDFCRAAPERFAGMAPISFHDVEETVTDIRWLKSIGMRGIVLPIFDADAPLFHEKFEPVWSELENLDMPVNVHPGTSGAYEPPRFRARLPHPAVASPLFLGGHVSHEILPHMIWGGVLERHPRLTVVFTETTCAWVVQRLTQMDYSYDGSYLSRDIRSALPLKPSEYYARQCKLGASIFSRAEIGARRSIGLEQLMLGVDMPHQEGAWNGDGGVREYLRATLGAEQVPEDEARRMLGETAATTFGFDMAALEPVAARLGLDPRVILSAPTDDRFPRGDVHKPLGAL